MADGDLIKEIWELTQELARGMARLEATLTSGFSSLRANVDALEREVKEWSDASRPLED